MTKLVAIDHKIHKHLKITPEKAELHGAELNLIPAVVAEFNNLAVQYPIVLTKNGETGAFVCTTLLGFEKYENLFWQNGQWQGVYVPLQIQRQPFFVGDAANEASTKNGDYIVCIDVDSPTIVESTTNNEQFEYQTLFTETGEDSQYFQQAKQCLAQLLQGEIDNEKLINMLVKLDLLQPLSVEITFVDEKSTRLNGLYTIDQDKLSALADEHIIALHHHNLLQPIYTMIASLGQIYALIERKNAKSRE